MDGMTLLAQARAAGLEVRVDGNRLVVRGPRRHAALAQELLTHKAEVLALLRDAPVSPVPGQEGEATPDATVTGSAAPRNIEGYPCRPWSTVGFRQELERRGWVVIYSRTLREPVLWLRDSNVVVPERWRKYVAYTLEELAALAGVTQEDLRVIHEAKRVMGGTVLPPEETVRLAPVSWKTYEGEGQECDKRAHT